MPGFAELDRLTPRRKALTHCYSFANGMVLSFDQYGEQMPEYQGWFEAVADKIKRDFPNIEIAAAHWRP